MNNILVTNNEINNVDNEYYSIIDNVITFKKSCDCSIYYSDCDNLKLEIVVCDNVFVKLFEYMDGVNFSNNINYNILDNAYLLLYKFYYCNKINENIDINLNGYLSKIDYHFSNICVNEEVYNMNINHNNSNSVSNIFNKSICLESGKVDFAINTYGIKNSVNCQMNQDTRIINLGDNHSSIKPNMYIDVNDVEARHGSVIGKFSEDELFYLMARGIAYDDALKLLVKGYIFSNLNVDMDKRNKILNIINKYWR